MVETHEPGYRSTSDEARALFEADPSSAWEAGWDNLASYKQTDWMRVADLERERLDRESRGR